MLRAAAALALAPWVMACAHAEVSLWVPEHMVAGGSYHGVVVLEPAPQHGALVLLSSGDGDAVRVPGTVTVRPHSNHGVFEVLPASEAETSISASVGGLLHSAQVRVFAHHGTPERLELVPAAASTESGSMLVHAGLRDRYGAPAPAGGDVLVRLTASGLLGAPDRVTIRDGEASAPFEVRTRGSGVLGAASDGLGSHEAEIGRVLARHDVRLGVAPGIAMRDSEAFYYVWIERDGRQYVPPHAPRVTLHTDNPAVGRFSAAHDPAGPGHAARLAGGVARGTIHTGEPGHATITAAVEGFGTASARLFVGPARLGAGGLPSPELQDLVGPPPPRGEAPADTLLAWVHPTHAAGDAWAVAATYRADHSRGLAQEAGPGGISSHIAEGTVLVPAEAYGRIVHASAPGLGLDGAHAVETRQHRTNALEFPVPAGAHGTHNITVSSHGMRPAAAALVAGPGYASGLRLGLVPVPAVPGGAAMVSLLDGATALDPLEVLGAGVQFGASAGAGSPEVGPVQSGSAVVSGVRPGSNVTVSLAGVGSATAAIPHGAPGAHLGVSMPQRVHAGEEFPFAAHEYSASGEPLRQVRDLRISASSEVSHPRPGFLVLASAGHADVSVHSGEAQGAASLGVEGFENRIGLEVGLGGTDLRVGEPVLLSVADSAGAEHEVSGGLAAERTGPGTYLLTAHSEGRHTVTVTAHRDGYAPESVSHAVSARLLHKVDVRAEDPEGGRLAVPFEISLGGAELGAVTPYHTESGPGALSVRFPAEADVGGAGYVLESLEPGGEGGALEATLSGDLEAVATYGRVVLVSVEGGTGSGVYRYGEAVRITAPDRTVVPLLVRETFGHWEGDLAGLGPVAEFEAVRDVHARASYRDDYAGLMLAVFLPALGAAAWISLGRAPGLRWHALNMLDRLAPRRGAR